MPGHAILTRVFNQIKIAVRCPLSMSASEFSRSARLALNFSNWSPSAAQWSDCCSRIETEEITRVHRFVFKKDAKAALVGRLLLRYFLTEVLGVQNTRLVFGRTEKGKPFLQEPTESSHKWNFNLSHSGDFVVFGAEEDALIGIDVMKIDFPRGKNLADYFTLMNSQFSSREWSVIKAPADDIDKLRNFYRLWCLKESYVKALGVGIGYHVSRLDFDLPVYKDPPPVSKRSITLAVDNVEQTDWTFSEFTVDRQHVGAVAIQASPDVIKRKSIPEISFVSVDQIVCRLEPLSEPILELGAQFLAKPERPS